MAKIAVNPTTFKRIDPYGGDGSGGGNSPTGGGWEGPGTRGSDGMTNMGGGMSSSGLGFDSATSGNVGNLFGSGGSGYDGMGFGRATEGGGGRGAGSRQSDDMKTLETVHAERPPPSQRLSRAENTRTVYKSWDQLTEQQRNIFGDRAPSGNNIFGQAKFPVVEADWSEEYSAIPVRPSAEQLASLRDHPRQSYSSPFPARSLDSPAITYAGGSGFRGDRTFSVQPAQREIALDTSPPSRYEYLQSRWGKMTNDEAREFIGYDNRKMLRFASTSIGDAVDLPFAIAQGRWTDAVADGVSVFGGKIVSGLGWAAGKMAMAIPFFRGVYQGVKITTPIGEGVGFHSYRAWKAARGPAGPGMDWHHIVEKRPTNAARFAGEMLHNEVNPIKLDRATHNKISAFYKTYNDELGMTPREYTDGLDFKAQYEYGLKVMRQYGVKI